MEKTIWSEVSLDLSTTIRDVKRERGHEPGSLDAARGLIIGLAISQVFWLLLVACVVLFWTHRI
ncbi:hypothetical protein [Novosphingobium sp.]|uniref:hypothetical protein n=1 Tax=Novosphingobium sp. TaxID=1874826 RepID=UPI003B52D5F2